MANGYQVVGMQELYDTVRGTGANNVVIAGGLSYAFDLSGVGSTPIQGYNIMYATHPYKPQDATPRWEGSFGYLATRDIAPVIATEFGDTTASTCTGAWDSTLIAFCDQHKINWTAWAWYPTNPPGCSFPSLISDWSATPSVQGTAVKAALAAYPSSPGGNPDAGTMVGSGGSGGDAGTGEADAGGDSGLSPACAALSACCDKLSDSAHATADCQATMTASKSDSDCTAQADTFCPSTPHSCADLDACCAAIQPGIIKDGCTADDSSASSNDDICSYFYVRYCE
jgi:hypothetical protein